MKGNKDEYSDSDEDQHDAYLERMKAEGKIREEANDSEESDGESGEWCPSGPITRRRGGFFCLFVFCLRGEEQHAPCLIVPAVLLR